jgi:hypothetical protein
MHYTMDIPGYKKRMDEGRMRVDPKLLEQTYGEFGKPDNYLIKRLGSLF